MNAVFDASRPSGKTSLSLHCGSPAADTVFTLPGVGMARVWDDGSLTAFDASGATVAHVRPGGYWGFLWT